jgi:hypothetical protein
MKPLELVTIISMQATICMLINCNMVYKLRFSKNAQSNYTLEIPLCHSNFQYAAQIKRKRTLTKYDHILDCNVSNKR